MFVTLLGKNDLVRFFIYPIIAFTLFFFLARELGGNASHLHIKFDTVVGLAGNNQWRARFINQDGVNFINQRISQAALDALLGRIDHVVAQIVKPKFIIGAVGNISRIGLLLFSMLHLRKVDANSQPQEAV